MATTYQRIELPNGMWLLMYEDGTLKLAGYDRRLEVSEVMNRDGAGHVFVKVTQLKTQPATITPRADDWVCVGRDET